METLHCSACCLVSKNRLFTPVMALRSQGTRFSPGTIMIQVICVVNSSFRAGEENSASPLTVSTAAGRGTEVGKHRSDEIVQQSVYVVFTTAAVHN